MTGKDCHDTIHFLGPGAIRIKWWTLNTDYLILGVKQTNIQENMGTSSILVRKPVHYPSNLVTIQVQIHTQDTVSVTINGSTPHNNFRKNWTQKCLGVTHGSL